MESRVQLVKEPFNPSRYPYLNHYIDVGASLSSDPLPYTDRELEERLGNLLVETASKLSSGEVFIFDLHYGFDRGSNRPRMVIGKVYLPDTGQGDMD